MSSIAWELSMQRTSFAKAQKKEVECIRRTAGVQCGAWNSGGWKYLES